MKMSVKSDADDADEKSKKIFEGLIYSLSASVDTEVKAVLDSGGAKEENYLLELVDVYICNDPQDIDAKNADLYEKPLVNSRWVTLSAECGSRLPMQGFSPREDQLFSGIVACPSQLSPRDSNVIWTLLTFHGGETQLHLNKKCTHLICERPEGEKYEMAMSKNIRIVNPDWVLDCVKEKVLVDQAKYHPRLLIPLKPPTPPREPTPDPEPLQPPHTPPHATTSRPFDLPLLDIPYGEHMRESPQAKLRLEASRTKQALARMLSGRKADGETSPMGPSPLGSPRMGRGGSHPGSPRMLQNITNKGGPRSPSRSDKMSQIVNSLSRPPAGQMSPGRSALAQQLQQNMAQIRQASAPPHMTHDLPMYYGHDPIERVPPDLCLLGCVFFITDYQNYLDAATINTWKKVIDQNGGQVDENYSNRITHVMCETQRSQVFQMALRDQKRLVTAHWMDDVITRKRLVPPWMALHFPSPCGRDKPCTNQVICVTNFEAEERSRVKMMISAIGAKYTGYMTHANSVIVCKRQHGVKYEKALEWRIPVVTVQWLSDLLLGRLDALKLPVNPRYQQFGAEDEFRIDPWRVAPFMEGWKMPLRIPRDAWKMFSQSQLLRRVQEAQQNAEKRKAEEELAQAAKRPRLEPAYSLNGEGVPVVLLTGFPKKRAELLTQQVERLGGHVVSSAKGCTHLVAHTFGRTVKFLTSLSVVKHVVIPEWIEQSALENKFLDENNFVLRDTRAETEYNFKLQETLQRAKERRVFQDLTFYVSPEVVPKKNVLQEIIVNAGGKMADKRPSVKTMKSMAASLGHPAFIVISCEKDMMLLRDMTQRRIPVYNAEFVIMGVVRQQVHFDLYQIES